MVPDGKMTPTATAIIMARGGSKRVPGKNVRPFCGEPMVAWPTKQARASDLFSTIAISTDDRNIAAIAREHGANLHLERLATLANDTATTLDVLHHDVAQLQQQGVLTPHICCLYGTSVFATPTLLHQGYTLLQEGGADWIFAMTAFAHPVQRGVTVADNGLAVYTNPEAAHSRTQDLPVVYHDIGLFYWFNAELLLQRTQPHLATIPKKGIIVSRTGALDIDTEEDFILAEHVFSFYLHAR